MPPSAPRRKPNTIQWMGLRVRLSSRSFICCAFALAVIGLSAAFLSPVATAALAGRPLPYFTDFDIFDVAGSAALRGRLPDAYDMGWMVEAGRSLDVPAGHWMAYTYPPTAALLFAPIAVLPPAWAFLALQAFGVAVFATGLSALCDSRTRPWLMAASLPLAVLAVCTGQTGLLAAGVLAHGVRLALCDRPRRAGLCAALVTLKPHLALGLPFYFLLRLERVAILALGGFTALLACASVALFGWPAWPAFLRAAAVASQNLVDGAYPVSRLTSFFALAVAFGLSGRSALFIHALALVMATALVAAFVARHRDPRLRCAACLTLATFVSPYAYDYDGANLVVAGAVLAPVLLARAGPWVSANLLTCFVAAKLSGLAWWTVDGRGGVAALLTFPVCVAAHALAARKSPGLGSGDDCVGLSVWPSPTPALLSSLGRES